MITFVLNAISVFATTIVAFLIINYVVKIGIDILPIWKDKAKLTVGLSYLVSGLVLFIFFQIFNVVYYLPW